MRLGNIALALLLSGLSFAFADVWGASPSVMTAAAAEPGFTTSASVSPTNVAAGGTVSITASVQSSSAATVLVDIEVYSPSGARVFQQWFDNQVFSAGQVRSYLASWQVATSAAAGTYVVKLGVFSPGWSTLYHWNNGAAQISVGSSAPSATATATPTQTPTAAPTRTPTPSPTATAPATPTATPRPGFTTTASVAPSTVAAGDTLAITAAVTSGAATTALVDVEVYSPAGQQVFQQWFDNQSFAAGQRREYLVTWQTPTSATAGTHVVKIGIFSNDWSTNFHWNDRAAELSVTAAPATATPTAAPATATPTAAPATATPTAAPATATPTATSSPAPVSGAKQFGVNVAGADFGESHLPGTQGIDYIYAADAPRQAYFASKGQTLIRIPFRWERVQRAAFEPLWADDVAGLRAMLNAVAGAGQKAILDMHNYARYYGAPLTRAEAAKLADAWQRLAREFRGHAGLYGYEIMNEPHSLPEGSDSWAYIAQVTTDAIRREDQSAWILIPGYQWQGAWTWPQNNPSLDVRDSAGRLLYAAHQYFDNDGSGSYDKSYHAEGAHPAIGADRVRPFRDWLAQRNARGILTEYGVPDNDPRWLEVLDRFLAALDVDSRIEGGTYWAAGPWWGSYPLSVEPRSGQDRPQMSILVKHPSRQ